MYICMYKDLFTALNVKHLFSLDMLQSIKRWIINVGIMSQFINHVKMIAEVRAYSDEAKCC